MGAFDIGGRIVIDGEFDQTFDRLEMRAEDAERALNQIEMPEIEETGKAAEQIALIAEQLERVSALSDAIRDLRVEVDTDEADRQLLELQARVDELREKLAGGQELTPVETDFLDGAQKAVDGFSGSLGGAVEKTIETAMGMAKMAKIALGVAGAVSVAVGAVYNFVKAQGMMGDALLRTERSFEALSAVRGVDADALLGGLEEAARGAVSASELMKGANQVILAGAEEIANQLPQIYDAARVSAELTGRTTAQAFQGITASVLKLDEAGLRAQGLFVNLTQANQEWAAANDRLAETLSLVEKQQIAANAAAAAAAPLMREMGLEARTAEEKLALLPAVLDEVKEGFAKIVASGALFEGFLNFMEKLGEDAQATANVREIRSEVEALEESLRSLGEIGAADALAESVKELKQEEREAALAGGFNYAEQAAITELYAEKLQVLTEAYRELAASANPELLKMDAFRVAAANATEAADATSTFDAALTRARENMAGVAAIEGQFASAIATAEAAMRNMPEMPDITAFTNTDELRAWGDAWLAINPNLAEAHANLMALAFALDQNRAAILTQAAGISDLGARMEFLAGEYLGAGASVEDLTRNMADLPPELLAALGPTEDLALAINRLRDSALAPITIDVAIQGLEATSRTIDNLAVRVGSNLGLEQGRIFLEAAKKERDEFWAGVDKSDELGSRVAVERWDQMLGDIVAMTDPALGQVAQSFKSTFDDIGQSAGELRGKIENALMEGSTVTAQDFADTLAGTYDDAPLEAARRLDAIAARGFAELSAHPDWAGLLKIPEGVLTGSEAELKAWAAQLAGSVRNLERPDLIDWDAFAANFEAGLDREAAREVTIDVALSELEGRGLLSGSPEERRQKVIEALGLEAPKLTFDALFKAEEGAGQGIREQVGPITLDAALELVEGIWAEGEKGNPANVVVDPVINKPMSEVIAEWNQAGYAGGVTQVDIAPRLNRPMSEVIAEWYTAGTAAGTGGSAATLGIEPTFIRPLNEIVAEWKDQAAVAGGESASGVDVAGLFNPEASQPALAAAGAQAINYVEIGAENALLLSNMGQTVASSWSTNFAGQQPVFEAIGTSLGQTVGAAFLTAMETNAGQARRRIAELVAPEVATILNQSGGGALP